MIDGIPNRPLLFFQKDIIGHGAEKVAGAMLKGGLKMLKVRCVRVQWNENIWGENLQPTV